MTSSDDLIRTMHGTRVLIAEDDRAFALFARYVLAKIGCETEIADDAADALRRLADASRRYDAVVVDPTFVDASGRSVASHVPELRPYAAVLAVSESPDVQHCRHDVWLSKPYQPAALIRAMAHARTRSLARRRHGAPAASAP